MNIKFFGTRGSIPVSGKDVKKYGGDTTCLYIKSFKGENIIIDSGTGIRKLGINLINNGISKINLIFTHYHWDHIQGFPFFAPAYIKESFITIYGPSVTISPKRALAYQMASPFFPALLENLPAKIEFKKIADSFNIGDINVKTIVNNHPGDAIGLRFTEDKKSFVFMTDNELFANAKKTSFKKFVKFVKGADYLTHDAQYTEKIYKPSWGHSTFSQVMQLAKESGVKNVSFTHHDPGSSDKFIDEIVANLQKEFPNYNIEGAVDGKTVHLN